MKEKNLSIVDTNGILSILESTTKDVKSLISLLRDLNGVTVDENLLDKIKSAAVECIIERTKICIHNLSNYIS